MGALMRKSLSGNWKTNVGDVEIKEVTVQERYKKWIDEASSLFGGLELCSLEAIVDGAGQEYIIEINDCAMGLMGDGQDEDRKLIAEVVIKEMEAKCKVPVEKPAAPLSDVANDSRPDSVQSTISSDKRKMSVTENGAKEEKEEKKEPKKKERSTEKKKKKKKGPKKKKKKKKKS